MQCELFKVESGPGVGGQKSKSVRYPYWMDEKPRGGGFAGAAGDLFGEQSAAGAAAVRYGSGASAKWDFLGYQLANAPVGVTATELSPEVVILVKEYVRKGGAVFVDSGAFGALREGRALDFEREVFPVYDALVASQENCKGLLMVMPDVIGNPDATAAVQAKYIDRIKGWMDAGVEAMFPIQESGEAAVARYEAVKALIGDRTHVVGVPSNAHAWSAGETVDFAKRTKPQRMHLLGLGKKGVVEELVGRINGVSPTTAVTCDSCQILANVGHGRRVTDRTGTRLEAAVSEVAAGKNDEVPVASLREFMVDVIYTPGFLDAEQAKKIGDGLGYRSPDWAEKFVNAAAQGLTTLLAQLDPDEEWIEEALTEVVERDIYEPLVRKKLTGPVRAYEIARMVLGDDPEWVRFKQRMQGG